MEVPRPYSENDGAGVVSLALEIYNRRGCVRMDECLVEAVEAWECLMAFKRNFVESV